MNEQIQNNNHASHMPPKEAFTKTRDYFLGQSLKPSEDIPDLLSENRKIALALTESVINIVSTIANYFGVQTMDLIMNSLPDASLHLEADGIREKAAARTYIDLRGAVPLTDICKSTFAYPVPTLHYVAEEILRRERKAEYAAHDPMLNWIFGGLGNPNHRSGTNCNDEADENEDSGTPMKRRNPIRMIPLLENPHPLHSKQGGNVNALPHS